MQTLKWTTAVAAVATVGVSALAQAQESDARIAALEQQRSEIDQRIESLRQDRRTWLSPEEREEVRALVHEAMSDAQTRASFLQDGATAGWDRGFYLRSGDGNYLLRIAGRAQFRYLYNYQDDGPGDDSRGGFEMRRTRLAFSGHMADPSWGYQIQGDFNRDGGGFRLLDAYIDKKFENGWTLRFGQFRHQFMKEDSMSSARQLAVERSLVNSRFAQSRTQGVELRGSVGDLVNWSIAYTDGINAALGDAGSGANTPWQARATEYAFTGRVEGLVAGNWRQFRDFTSWADEEFGLLIGGAGHWQRDEYGTMDDVTEMLRGTVDAMAKFGGANAFLAFVGNHESTKNNGSVDQYGLVAQGGVFVVPDKMELFGRYEWGDADTLGSDLSLITFGFNYFLRGHNLKWTTDIGVGLKEVSSYWASSSAGWRTDSPDKDGQVVVRSQFQLAF